MLSYDDSAATERRRADRMRSERENYLATVANPDPECLAILERAEREAEARADEWTAHR